MQLVRRSDIRLTCKINFGNALGAGAGGAAPQRKNGIWAYTINTNSIFPIHRQGNFNDPNDFTMQYSKGVTAPPSVVVDTVWEANPGMPHYTTSPRILPKDGFTLDQMRSTDPAVQVLRPLVAPGLFEEESSPGYQYAEIAVMGTKVTAHWIPLVSDLDNQGEEPAPTNLIDGMQTEESRLFMFPQTQSVGQPYPAAVPPDNTANALLNADSSWEQDIALLPYVKSRTITGFTSQQKLTTPGSAGATKLGNGAVLTYKVNPAQIHGTTIHDERTLWSQNMAALPNAGGTNVALPKFQHPTQRNYLTIGICKSLKNGVLRCPPSGKLEIRIEQIIKMREPMSTRTLGPHPQNPAAAGAAGPNPGAGGGSFFPGNPYSAGRVGANLAAAAALAANFT